MSVMGFNEFQRELQKRQIPDNIAYVLTMMYEQVVEISKQGDQAAQIMLALAQTMENMTMLHEDTQRKVQTYLRGKADLGIDVHSVANEPED